MNFYKTFLLSITLILFFSVLSISQDKKRPNIKGTISGVIFDKEINKPLENATIQLFRVRDSSLVTGTATNSKGEFSLSDVPGGKFKMKVSFIGYNTAIVSGIAITPDNKELKLEQINLTAGSETTNEIDVTAERSYMEVGIDKKIFNIGKDIVSESGSALDALKNIPSVTVDIDGNVSMRGSGNIKFLINGRPTNLGGNITDILDQIPANTIDKIEIITNPSAKYDPEGTSGIINIILKKEQDLGYNLNLNLNSGTQDKYNISTTFNLRKDKINLSGNYGFRSFRMGFTGNSSRTNNINDTVSYLTTNSSSINKMIGHIGGLGLDYFIDNKNTLSFSGSYSHRNRDRNSFNDYDNLDFNQNPFFSYDRNNYNNEKNDGWDLSLNYQKKYDTPKKELNILASYSGSNEEESEFINQYNILPVGSPYFENDYTPNKYYTGIIQADYYHPLKDDDRFELGYKSTFNEINSDYNAYILDNISQNWILNSALSDHFIYRNQIHAIFGNYAMKLGSFAFQAGLRLEQTFTSSNSLTMEKQYDNNYFAFFPSIFFTQSITPTQDLQLSYTRRINRPRSRFLDPLIDYSDPQNLSMGNPKLNPEYINSFELGYLKYFNSFTITSSIFYKQTNDVINRFTVLTDSNVTMTTFENISKATSYGFEFIAAGNIWQWWFLNSNFSYYKTILQGNLPTGELDNSNYTWNARLSSTFSFPKLFDFQINFNYQGKTVTAQGTNNPFQTFDLSFKKNLFNKKITVGFRISDLFNSSRFASTSFGPGFDMFSTRKRESRVAFLTLTFRFGKEDKSQSRKKQKKDENDNENMDDY